ncbi:cyclophilin-like fold protein [Phocaeicola sp.]|uniref:cyclophilin-like fold protein n=1 Tax=Phocaeicola sp. TaxID=2773926 RepID=UPI003AB8AE58
MERNSIKLTIKNGETFTATLTDNSSAKGLMELLSKGDITIEMEDYGNMEKVGPLGTNLPRNDRQTTTGPGDIILYQGKYLVIYYDTNSWNFTWIGKIDNANAAYLKSALGNGNVTVTLSLNR